MRSVWLLAVGSLVGCNSLMGIDEARVDPRLEASSFENAPGGDEEGDAGDGVAVSDLMSSGGAPGTPAAEDGTDDAITDEAENLESESDEAGTDEAEIDGAETEEPVSEDAESQETEEPEAQEVTLCEQYCEEVMELCTDDIAQYRDMLQCMTVCSLLPEGELTADENDNSVACRLRYASKARYAAGTEHEAYCRQAGPGGDGRCGSNCEGFCSIMMEVCNEDDAGIYRFQSEAACLDTCEALPVSQASYSTTNVEVADGNHVQCRLFHVTSAAMLDPEEHCEHSMGLTLCEAEEEEPEVGAAAE